MSEREWTSDDRASIAHALMHLDTNKIADDDYPGYSGWYCGNREQFVKRHKKAVALMRSLLTPNAPRQPELDSGDRLDADVRQALGHLRGLVDILGPCEHFDHHGYCQTHFIESPCRVGKAREFLESMPNARPHAEARSADSVQADVRPGGDE